MKKCPYCPGSLTPENIGNVSFLRCLICEGLWFIEKNLERVLFIDQLLLNKTDLNDISYQNLDKKKENFSQQGFCCPFCDRAL